MKKITVFLLSILFITCAAPDVTVDGNVLFVSEYGSKLPDKFCEVWVAPQNVTDTIAGGKLIDRINAFEIKWADFKYEKSESIGESLKPIAEKLFFDLEKLQDHQFTISTKCDSDGKFKVSLKEGKYFIIVRSANKKNLNMLDILGTIETQPLTVKNGINPVFIEISR